MTSLGTFMKVYDRKFGLCDSTCFRRSLVSNFFGTLRPCIVDEVSKYRDSAITSLDIDFSESRYLLNGNRDGCIAIHDVNGPESLENKVKLLAVLGNRPNVDNLSCYVHTGDAHRDATTRVNWWPVDNGMFTSSSIDGKLKIWDTNALSVAAEFDTKGMPIFSHAAAKTSNIVALAGKGVVLYDLNSGSGFQKLGGKDKVLDVQWLVDCDRYLLSCSPDGGLVVYDIRKYEVVIPLIASSNVSPVIYRRDLEGGSIRRCRTKSSFYHRPITSHITQDSQNVLCVCSDGTVLHFLLSQGYLVAERKSETWAKYSGFTFQMSSPRLLNSSLVFIPNGSSKIHMYNCDTRKMISLPHAHFKSVLCCAIDQVNLKLLTGGYDKRILTFAAPNRCHFLDDGSFDVTAVDDVSDWDGQESTNG